MPPSDAYEKAVEAILDSPLLDKFAGNDPQLLRTSVEYLENGLIDRHCVAVCAAHLANTTPEFEKYLEPSKKLAVEMVEAVEDTKFDISREWIPGKTSHVPIRKAADMYLGAPTHIDGLHALCGIVAFVAELSPECNQSVTGISLVDH